MIDVSVRAKHYGGLHVLKDIHFRVEEGECLALLGPSGVGKTTLLRIAAGLQPAFEGKVNCAGPKAMVFQEPTLLPWRTAEENISLIHPGADAVRALNRVGLADRAEHFPGQLSLGQQRRLALARAFAGRPKTLFLDEPFVSLDPELAEEMMILTEELIGEHRPAVLFVTHELAQAERLATHKAHLAGKPATLGGLHEISHSGSAAADHTGHGP